MLIYNECFARSQQIQFKLASCVVQRDCWSAQCRIFSKMYLAMVEKYRPFIYDSESEITTAKQLCLTLPYLATVHNMLEHQP